MTAALIILALIVLNGLFVAAEFAIIGAPRATMSRLAREGDRSARMVAAILTDARAQDRFIATAQLGITLASLGLGMYGEHVLAVWFAPLFASLGGAQGPLAHTLASVLAVTLLTYLHIVLGEMVPKSLALQHAARAARAVAPGMRLIGWIMYPAVVTLNGIGNGLLRLIGIRRNAGGPSHLRSASDLEEIVRESRASGRLSQAPAHVLAELLDFPDLTAGEVMVPRVRVVGLEVGTSETEWMDTVAEAEHVRYPVFVGTLDGIIGLVHVKDLLRLSGGVLRPEDARPVPFVPETAPIESVLAVLRRERAQLAIVMDEHGGTAGLVTLEDVLEEIVGEIDEESGVPEMAANPEGRTIVLGTVRLDELSERLGMPLEHEAVDTVSGLLLDRLGRPPRVGDVVVYQGLRFEVTAVAGHGVAEAAVRRNPADAPPVPPRP
jgi:CBS domain containing-hemolysin-like protein